MLILEVLVVVVAGRDGFGDDDYVSLTDILIESVGMRDVREYDWRDTEHSQFDDHSQSYLPHMDKENGISMSLNVECRK